MTVNDDWSFERSGVDLRAECRQLNRALGGVEILAERSVRSISLHAAQRGVANAPILSGLLRSETTASPVTQTGNEDKTWGSRVGQYDRAWYAPIQFVFLQPHAVFPVLNLGPISSQQPDTVEGGVGGTWLERVINHWEPTYTQRVEDAFDQLIYTGRLSPPFIFT